MVFTSNVPLSDRQSGLWYILQEIMADKNWVETDGLEVFQGPYKNICYENVKRICLEHWFKIHSIVGALKRQISELKCLCIFSYFPHICQI